MKQSDLAKEPRYSAIRASVVALIRPVTAVRRADHLPLWKAWGVHLAGGAMVCVISVLMIFWDSVRGPINGINLILTFFEIRQWLLETYTPWQAITGMIFFAMIFELGWCISAAVVMPWSARDEPLRQSYGRSLRRLYLLTPHLATITLLSCGAIIWLGRASRGAHYRTYQIHEVMDLLIVATTCYWSLWVALAAVGIRMAPAMSRWPARCMGCGYQLVGLKREMGCPECGKAIADSLNKNTRPGIKLPGGLIEWSRQTYWAVRRPTTLGQRMHVLSPDHGHRRYFAITLRMLMLGSVVGFALLYMIVSSVNNLTNSNLHFDWRIFVDVTLIGGILTGLVAIATTTASMLCGAVVIGSVVGWQNGRNLMPAAIRVACYQSGFMVFWSAVCWCNMAICIILVELDLLSQYAGPSHLPIELLIMTWQLLVLGLGLVIYMILIGWTTRVTRFANW